MTAIYEKVHVYARSHGGNVVPLQFIWRQQKYDVYEILEITRKTVGRQVVFQFKVTTLPKGTFDMEFDLRQGQWYLLSASFE